MFDPISFFTVDLTSKIDDLTARIQQSVVPPSGPRVIVVPALPGSQLGHRLEGRDDTVWFNFESIRRGRLLELGTDAPGPPLEPLGVFEPVYLQMMLRLRLAGYDVTAHPYDWRRSFRELGEELAARIRAEDREVHLVTHSFGGLVARAALLAGAPRVGKVVMLGTPNHGCFEVVQGVRGNHWVLHTLSAVDGTHDATELAARGFGTFPSVYESLPEPMSAGDFDTFDPSAWPREGLRPREDLLAGAASAKQWLAGGPAPAGGFHVIAGYGTPTIQRIEVRDGVFHFLRSNDGDGFVTTSRAPLNGHACYYTRCAHIGLPNHGNIIGAVEDILVRGSTDLLSTAPPAPSACMPFTEADLKEPPFQGRRGDALTLDDLRQGFDELLGLVAPVT